MPINEAFFEECLIVVLFGLFALAVLMNINLVSLMDVWSSPPEEDYRVNSTAYFDNRHPYRDNLNPFRDDTPVIYRKPQTDLIAFIIKCLKTTFYSVQKSDTNSKLSSRDADSHQSEKDQLYLVLMSVFVMSVYLLFVVAFIYIQRQVIFNGGRVDEYDGYHDVNEDDDDDDRDIYDGYNNFGEYFDNNFLRDNLLFPGDDTDSENGPGEFNGVNHGDGGDDNKTLVANQQLLFENRYQLLDDDGDYVVEGVLQPNEGLIGSNVIEALNGHFGSVHGVGVRDSTIGSVFINDIPGMPPTWEDVNGSVFRPLREFEDGERVLVIF